MVGDGLEGAGVCGEGEAGDPGVGGTDVVGGGELGGFEHFGSGGVGGFFGDVGEAGGGGAGYVELRGGEGQTVRAGAGGWDDGDVIHENDAGGGGAAVDGRDDVAEALVEGGEGGFNLVGGMDAADAVPAAGGALGGVGAGPAVEIADEEDVVAADGDGDEAGGGGDGVELWGVGAVAEEDVGGGGAGAGGVIEGEAAFLREEMGVVLRGLAAARGAAGGAVADAGAGGKGAAEGDVGGWWRWLGGDERRGEKESSEDEATHGCGTE